MNLKNEFKPLITPPKYSLKALIDNNKVSPIKKEIIEGIEKNRKLVSPMKC